MNLVPNSKLVAVMRRDEDKVRDYAVNQAKAYDVEDLVGGSFIFENGVLGTGNWCFTVSQSFELDEIIIYGSKGKISFETFGKGEFFLEKEGQDSQHFELELPYHIQQPLIQSIVEDLLGTGMCKSTGKTGARTNWVMDELVKSYYSIFL